MEVSHYFCRLQDYNRVRVSGSAIWIFFFHSTLFRCTFSPHCFINFIQALLLVQLLASNAHCPNHLNWVSYTFSLLGASRISC